MSIYTKRFISTKRPRQQVLDAQNYVHPCPEKCAEQFILNPCLSLDINSNFLKSILHNISAYTIKHSGMNIGLAIGKHHGWKDNTMPRLRAMFLDEGPNKNIRCRFICDWCKVESYVYSNARLYSEIEKTNPDVVVMDIDMYAKIDGIETSRRIRSQFGVPVMYV